MLNFLVGSLFFSIWKKKQPPTQIVQISRRLLFSFFHEKTRVFLVFSSIYQWAFHFFRKNQKLFLGTIITVSYSCKQNLNVDDFGYFDRKRKRFSEQYCLNTKKYFFENTKVFQSNIAWREKQQKFKKTVSPP